MALLPKNQRDQAMVLVALIAVALIGVYWMYVYSPRATELTALQVRVDTLEHRNAAARNEARKGRIDSLKAEAERYQKDLEVMRQLVPTGNEVPALLEQVSTAARQVGLDIATVEPEPVIEGDQFDTYRYKLSVTGGYHAIGEFLTNVGSLTRIVAPINLSVTPSASAQSQPSRTRSVMTAPLDARFEVQTFVARTSRPAGGKS